MANFFDDIANAIINAFSGTGHGKVPQPDTSMLVKDYKFCRGLKCTVSRRVTKILEAHPEKRYKFGKTGKGVSRAEWKGYIEASYHKMYFLYESTSSSHVDDLEVYYIKKHKEIYHNDNERDTDADRMSRESGRYHVYLMI
ncbi:MAG TPA: hypothetical protein VNX01_14775 [Bacteroidia bacterium]|jgi:hypothetical protein|nr:hypothetical protein [Bacteroidia bacterium]